MSAARARRVVLLRPRSDDAFPAIELEAATVALVEGEDRVLVPSHVDPEAARLCAEVLGGELQGRPWAVRAVRIVTRTDDDAAGDHCPPWSHWLRLRLEDGSFRDFAVVARGLPADELEALQHGYEYGELDLVVLPHHGRHRLN